MSNNNQKPVTVALQAAFIAGQYLKENFDKNPQIEFKGEIDLITQMDRQSQELILQQIKQNFPQHSILAEEDVDIRKSEKELWLIDPLDGTTNYAHSLPVFSVSIAFLKAGIIEAGVVYNPMLEETFSATRGEGAFLNQKKISVSAEKKIGRSLLATGFPYDLRENCAESNLPYFQNFLFSSQGIRRWGSAAIDLCYTACGRFDGFWELKLNPWDTAAGALIVQEAGGKITDFSGKPFDPFKGECLASNGKIHQQMLEIFFITTGTNRLD